MTFPAAKEFSFAAGQAALQVLLSDRFKTALVSRPLELKQTVVRDLARTFFKRS
jgi:hypothetical protein